MPLFYIEHRHSAEKCPRQNPEMVRQLASYVTAENAQRMGVKLLADFVNEPEHTVILVLETDSAEKAFQFALPFLNVGSVTIKIGGTCEDVARECLGEL